MKEPTMMGSDRFSPENVTRLDVAADPTPTIPTSYLSIRVFFDKITLFKGDGSTLLMKFDLNTMIDPSKNGLPDTGLTGYQIAPILLLDGDGQNVSVNPSGLIYPEPAGQLVKFSQNVKASPSKNSKFDITKGGILYPSVNTSVYLIPVSPGTVSPVVTVE